jgi:hypothetical protein
MVYWLEETTAKGYNRYILLKKNRENIKRVIDTEKRLIKLRLDLVSEIVADREARKDL